MQKQQTKHNTTKTKLVNPQNKNNNGRNIQMRETRQIWNTRTLKIRKIIKHVSCLGCFCYNITNQTNQKVNQQSNNKQKQ